MPNNFTIDDLQAQRSDVIKAMNLPGIPTEEMAIYKRTLGSIDALIAEKKESAPSGNRITRDFSSKPNSHITPPSGRIPTHLSRTILAGNMTPQKEPMSSSIEFANNSDEHNPTLTVSFSDGYTITVTEAEASSRFKTTLRDSAALRCVSENRFDKMWRWDTPWRCAGFYQALTKFWGEPPTLQQLGISRPSEATKAVFALVAEKAESNQQLIK